MGQMQEQMKQEAQLASQTEPPCQTEQSEGTKAPTQTQAQKMAKKTMQISVKDMC